MTPEALALQTTPIITFGYIMQFQIHVFQPYIVVLADDEKTIDLDGWVTLDNQSGASYEDAKLKLIAGDIHRAPTDGYVVEKEMRYEAVAEARHCAPHARHLAQVDAGPEDHRPIVRPSGRRAYPVRPPLPCRLDRRGGCRARRRGAIL